MHLLNLMKLQVTPSNETASTPSNETASTPSNETASTPSNETASTPSNTYQPSMQISQIQLLFRIHLQQVMRPLLLRTMEIQCFM